MGKYIVKRILQVIPMLFILSLIVFMMVRLIPGDPVDMMLGRFRHPCCNLVIVTGGTERWSEDN